MLAALVDGLIVVLLLVVLGRGLLLQRNLRARHDDGEIDRLIAALDRATGRAQAALDGLRQTAEASGERLAGQLASAQRLVDDLQFLASRGEQAADRLAEQIRRERPAAQRSQSLAPEPDRAPPAGGPDRMAPAADLERTLRTLR